MCEAGFVTEVPVGWGSGGVERASERVMGFRWRRRGVSVAFRPGLAGAGDDGGRHDVARPMLYGEGRWLPSQGFDALIRGLV